MGTLFGVFASGIVLLPTLLLAALITFAAARGSRNKYVASTSTVLERFLINPSPSEGPAIYISGRYKGLIAWLLTNLGMETRIELTVTSKYLSLRQASLAGMKIDYIPLSRIRATICGYQQSLLAFFLAVFFSLNGLWMLLGALPLLVHGISENTEYGWQTTDKDISVVLFVAFCWLLGAGAAMLAYHLSKRAALGVRAVGESAVGIVFKRSLVEGQVIDLEMAERGTALLNRLVQAAADNVPLDQVLALPPPQSPEKGRGVLRAWMAIAGYAALFIVASVLAWYGNGVDLKVNAMPAGSSVWLDNQFFGVTNDNGTLAIPHVLRQGHDVRIWHQDYQPYVQHIILGKMASFYDVTAHLALLNYPVTVITWPPSSVVVLDGKDGGMTNGGGALLLPNVDRGIHQLVVSHQGYRDATGTIRVYGRSTIRIELLNLAEAARQEAEAHQREINEHLDRARALFHQAQYQSAQDECDAALKLDPANAAAQALKKQIEQTRKILGR